MPFSESPFLKCSSALARYSAFSGEGTKLLRQLILPSIGTRSVFTFSIASSRTAILRGLFRVGEQFFTHLRSPLKIATGRMYGLRGCKAVSETFVASGSCPLGVLTSSVVAGTGGCCLVRTPIWQPPRAGSDCHCRGTNKQFSYDHLFPFELKHWDEPKAGAALFNTRP